MPDSIGTYTGINPVTGAPIGFTPLPQTPSTGVSIDSEYGQAKDPRISTSQNIKAEYSDNFVLGLQHQFDLLQQKWVGGLTGTYQKMPRIIDDYDDEQRECAAGLAQGYTWMTPANCTNWAQSLVLINPGVTQHLLMKSPTGSLVPVTLTPQDQGFPQGVDRQYYSLDFSLARVWDGKWSVKVDYVFSKTWGNTEGPVSTYSQQSGSYESITTAWDFPERMQNSYGILPNDRRHQFKAYGAYSITPDWSVGANLYAASGTPKMCRGPYGPEQLRSERLPYVLLVRRPTGAAGLARPHAVDHPPGPEPGLQAVVELGRLTGSTSMSRCSTCSTGRRRCSSTTPSGRPTVRTPITAMSRISHRRAVSDSRLPMTFE